MKTFDILEKPSLQQLFNSQKARVYEFWLQITKLQKTRRISGDNVITLDEWIYQPHEDGWNGKINSDQPKKFRQAFIRVQNAKKRFEQAGGDYEKFRPADYQPHKADWDKV